MALTVVILNTNSTIGGGKSNCIKSTDSFSIIAGGCENQIGDVSGACKGNFIGGGTGNRAVFGGNSSIVGGLNNLMVGGICTGCSFIGGGEGNINSSCLSFTGGGQNNCVDCCSAWAVLVGGRSNIMSGSSHSVIAGGLRNTRFSSIWFYRRWPIQLYDYWLGCYNSRWRV